MRTIQKITRNVKTEATRELYKMAKKNMQKRLVEQGLDFENLSTYEQSEMIEKEKLRLENKAKDIGVGAVLSFAVSMFLGF